MSRLSRAELEARVMPQLTYRWLERFVGFQAKKETGELHVRFMEGKKLSSGWTVQDKSNPRVGLTTLIADTEDGLVIGMDDEDKNAPESGSDRASQQ